MTNQPLPALRSFNTPTTETLLASPDFDLTLSLAAEKLGISYLDALARFANSFVPDLEMEAAIAAAEREQCPIQTIEDGSENRLQL